MHDNSTISVAGTPIKATVLATLLLVASMVSAQDLPFRVRSVMSGILNRHSSNAKSRSRAALAPMLLAQWTAPTPSGLAAGKDCLYVINRYGQVISRFNADGTPRSPFPFRRFVLPWGIAVDRKGYLYVSDHTSNGSGVVYKFSPDGAVIWSVNTVDGLDIIPYGVAVDPAGNTYFSDWLNHRIVKLAANGDFLCTWGRPGTQDGELNRPAGLAIDRSGNILVADSENGRIQRFSSSGVFLDHFGDAGSQAGQLSFPLGIFVDATGTISVSDAGSNQRIQEFSADGDFLSSWGYDNQGNDGVRQPHALTTTEAGTIYVADYSNNRILIFRRP